MPGIWTVEFAVRFICYRLSPIIFTLIETESKSAGSICHLI